VVFLENIFYFWFEMKRIMLRWHFCTWGRGLR